MESIPSLFRAGDQIFMPGSSAEPTPVIETLAAAGDALPDIHVTNSFVPGVNTLPLAAANSHIDETAIFPRGGPLLDSNRIRQMPLSYFGFSRYLGTRQFDWAVVHVSAPNESGEVSLGTSVEFLPTVLRNCGRLLGVVNPSMPNLRSSPHLKMRELDEQVEAQFPLVSYDVGEVDEVSSKIASHLGDLIDDGSVIQIGLGKIPDKLIASLTDRRRLRFHSGMLSDSFLTLAEAGALDPDFTHLTCSALGSTRFYETLSAVPKLKITGVEESHLPDNLMRLDGFIAINSALEVDLFGQANLEVINGQPVSGVGGAPDFARAAASNQRSLSIIALPATGSGGRRSRIVAGLGRSPASLSRLDVDYVVTEFGAARLVDRSVQERARALIDIAAPHCRDQLAEDWGSSGTSKSNQGL